MPTELILAGNGPGELSGWIRPVARAARTLSSETRRDLCLTLALPPSQFATGREPAVAKAWELFDRVVRPRECIRLAFGLGRLAVTSHAALIHLGGDLWFSARLARHLGIPACALAETPLIARRHRPFARVFAVSDALAHHLIAQGVPPQRIVVTGDPRADALADEPRASTIPFSSRHPPSGSSCLAFFPGSRGPFFTFLVPYFLDTARAITSTHPGLGIQVVVSPFLSRDLVAEVQEETTRRWPGLQVEWIHDPPWTALARADLVVTIPGTNTIELAMAGIPFAVVLPTHEFERARAEGMLEWVSRLPGLGRVLKRAALSRILATHHFLALPNRRAGRAVVPEWVGRWTPTELAKRVADLLDSPRQRIAMVTAFRELYGDPPGASTSIVRHALALAEGSMEIPA